MRIMFSEKQGGEELSDFRTKNRRWGDGWLPRAEKKKTDVRAYKCCSRTYLINCHTTQTLAIMLMDPHMSAYTCINEIKKN